MHIKDQNHVLDCGFDENNSFINHINRISLINDKNVDCFYSIYESNDTDLNYKNDALILNISDEEFELVYLNW